MPRYIKLHVQLLDNLKVQGQLSSDAARYHYIKLCLHGKLASPEGQWLNRDYLRGAVGDATFAFLAEFMATQPEGLVVEDPDGRIHIRQWWRWQSSDRKVHQDELDEQKRRKNRARWARNKREQRARGADMSAPVRAFVRDMSANVHPNRDTKSLYEDRGHTSPRPSPSVGDPAIEPIAPLSCHNCGTALAQDNQTITKVEGQYVYAHRTCPGGSDAGAGAVSTGAA